MSTRSQIEFIVRYGKQETRLRVYRHSDGYPEGVLSDLKEFFKWLTSEPEPRNPAQLDYTVANFVYWGKKKLEKYRNGTEKLGYGFDNMTEPLHGDIAYFYEVIIQVLDEDSFNPVNNISVNVYKTEWRHTENRTLLDTVDLEKFTEWKR